jgi:cytochrome oxidase Cu insertion factor (SCO1/SenC/PrrC family)
MRNSVISIVLLSSALMMGQGKPYPQPQTASAAGEKAPDFSLKDHEGRDFMLSSQRGRWVLLYFYRGYW